MLRLYIHCLSCVLYGPVTDLTQLQNVARLTVELFFILRKEFFFFVAGPKVQIVILEL